MGQLIDHTGQTFGRLTVIERLPSRRGLAFWRCLCECGNETETAGSWLRNGTARSCGCTRGEKLGARSRERRGKEHHQWKGDAVEYVAAHSRVRATRGRPREHACIDCGKQASDWSYRGECPREQISRTDKPGLAFSPDPEMYDPRCKRCHEDYDMQQRRKAREEVAP